MTKDKIIEVAKEAGIGLRDMRYHYYKLDEAFIDRLKLFLYLSLSTIYTEGFKDGVNNERRSKY